ncbi:MAG TPA: phosphate acyltransferase PlsX [Anaeromyxobacteraceae bacterium]|nr:phosphate acyltransferase PlsX [Anaeromyxobacteraceae bacterium]
MGPQSHGIAPIAVDAMGGDHAPGAAVQGAVAAARAGQAVILVGPEGKVREELRRQRAGVSLPLRIHHAAEVVEMGEHPGQAMRRKRDNSIRVAFELVRAGEASAMVSAGNSGAIMAAAILVLGRLGSVERPAFAQVLPAVKGRPLLLDMGANAECKPIHLVQFALMGEVWSRRVVGVARPRVAILANGQEPSKGTELTRRASAALGHAPLRFEGYCEGRDLLGGEFDVVVTDGFTGNVALKTMEGTARAVRQLVRQSLRSVRSRLGALLAQTALREVKRRLDWREVGGAPLLGVAGVGVVSHGASDALAIENAVTRARDAARAACTREMAEAAALAAGLLAAPLARRRHALDA